MNMDVTTRAHRRESSGTSKIRALWAIVLLCGSVGCSGGSGSDSPDDGRTAAPGDGPSGTPATAAEETTSGTTGEMSEADVRSGTFVDSPVQGLTFTTETGDGVTDANGTFDYRDGESVTFSIGDTRLPSTPAAERLTPVDLAAGSDDPTAMTINIASLLQSLDRDGDPSNGIDITAEAAASASAIEFDVDIETFARDPAVVNLVANSGSITTMLIDPRQALDHLNLSLDTPLSLAPPAGDEIVLDLRGTSWVEARETGCDGAANQVTLNYSQTGVAVDVTRAEDRGDGCEREIQAFDMTFADWNDTSAFILVCGGDALCTFQELNRTVEVPVGDPRNDCRQDGEPVSVSHRVSHEVGSDTIVAFNCDPDDADVYVRQ